MCHTTHHTPHTTHHTPHTTPHTPPQHRNTRTPHTTTHHNTTQHTTHTTQHTQHTTPHNTTHNTHSTHTTHTPHTTHHTPHTRHHTHHQVFLHKRCLPLLCSLLCETQCGRHLMSHAPGRRLPDVAGKGGSGPSSAMSKWRLRWPWLQRSITLRNVAVPSPLKRLIRLLRPAQRPLRHRWWNTWIQHLLLQLQ